MHAPTGSVSGNAVTTSKDGGGSWSTPLNVTSSLGAEGKARTGPGLGLLLQLNASGGATEQRSDR